MIFIVYTGWTGETAECYFIDALSEEGAKEQALSLFANQAPERFAKFHDRFSAQPLQVNRLTDCAGF
jgi:hypothetical protein